MGVSKCVRVCPGVPGHAQVCAGIQWYVWDDFSEYLLET